MFLHVAVKTTWQIEPCSQLQEIMAFLCCLLVSFSPAAHLLSVLEAPSPLPLPLTTALAAAHPGEHRGQATSGEPAGPG